MKAFTYQRADSSTQAAAAALKPGAIIIAGGTNLLDLMKLQVETPSNLIDINRLPLDTIDETPDGGLRIGALVRNSDLAADVRIRQRTTPSATLGHRNRPRSRRLVNRQAPWPSCQITFNRSPRRPRKQNK